MRVVRYLLFAGLAAWSGCASRPPPVPGGHRAPPEPEIRRLPEEFDPQVLDEDLLLIRPDFGPAAVSATHQGSAGSVSSAPDARRTTPATDTALEPVTVEVYGVQVLALSRAETAAERRAELQERLGVPVRVDTARGLFLVRAGECATAAEAERLKAEITALDPEYADAYLVSAMRLQVPPARAPDDTGVTAGSDAPLGGILDMPAVEPPAAPVQPPRMVQALGWRVLLDKVPSYNQAQQLKKRAVERLRRTDLDITFKAPWYNVEVGHYRTEIEAQEALERLKARFPQALKIRGQILIPAED